MAPTPPNASSSPQLIVSWALPIRGTNDRVAKESPNSPGERLRPRTCPSTIVSDNEGQRQHFDMSNDDYQDDFNDDATQFGAEADTDPLEIDWAVRYKMVELLNPDRRRRRAVLRKGSALYLISSWFEEEAGTYTIKAVSVGANTDRVDIPPAEITYDIDEMRELLRQTEDGTLTVHMLLEKTLLPLLP
jgi:hypothetical protein